MNITKINRFFFQTLAFAAIVISLSLFVVPAQRAAADAPPLKPGCYQLRETVYYPVNCATEGQARAIVRPLNYCFAGTDPEDLSQVSCDTGDVIAAAQPDNGTSNSGEEGGLNTVKNDCGGSNITAGAPEGTEGHCGILDYIDLFINVLSGVVGVVIVASLIYAGIQYSMAGADPKKVSAAKNRILNAVIALTLYLFFFSFLQWIVPGGLF